MRTAPKPAYVPRATSRPITPADLHIHVRPKLAPDLTVAQLAQAYLDEATRTGRELPNYRAPIAKHIVPAFEGLPARELVPSLVSAWIKALEAAGYAQGTISGRVSILGSICRFGVAAGVLDTNPVRDVPNRPSRAPLDPTKAAGEVLSLDRVRRILDDQEHQGPELRVVLSVLLLTGMRVGEASALTWGDLRYVGPLSQLRVQRSWNCRQGRVSPTKTGASRNVPVHPRLFAVLERWRHELREHLRRPVADTDLICPKQPVRWIEGGLYWGETSLLRRWHRTLLALGIEHPSTGPRRLHAARHTFDSLLVRAGASERSVRAITHDAPADASVFDRYVHLDWASLCEAVLKLEV